MARSDVNTFLYQSPVVQPYYSKASGLKHVLDSQTKNSLLRHPSRILDVQYHVSLPWPDYFAGGAK